MTTDDKPPPHLDVDYAPERWVDGMPGRPSRPVRGDTINDCTAAVTLDCGHVFPIVDRLLFDGWMEAVFCCPLPHSTVWLNDGTGIREIAPRVAETEERLRRAKRLARGDDGARLFDQMESLLRWFVSLAPSPAHPKVAAALALLDSIDDAGKAKGG